MNKKLRIVFLVAGVVIALWGTLVIADAIRLRNSVSGTQPWITIDEEKSEDLLVYTGLGYTVKYHVYTGEITETDGVRYVEQLGYGADFWLFDKILIWGWIE